jgi:predicted nucleic acid-binding protein
MLMAILVDACLFIDAYLPEQPRHEEAVRFLGELLRRNWRTTMPASAWFEVQCACERRRAKGEVIGGPLAEDLMSYPFQSVHIDQKFIDRYAKADIPHYGAGDHIFLAMAKIDGHVLVSYDEQMIRVAKNSGIHAFTPGEFMSLIATTLPAETLVHVSRPLSPRPC